MTLTKDMILNFSDGVHSREEEFGLLVVSNTTPAIVINHDGAFVWNLINGENTVGDIIKIVQEEYSGNIDDRVKEILENLVKTKLCYIKE